MKQHEQHQQPSPQEEDGSQFSPPIQVEEEQIQTFPLPPSADQDQTLPLFSLLSSNNDLSNVQMDKHEQHQTPPTQVEDDSQVSPPIQPTSFFPTSQPHHQGGNSIFSSLGSLEESAQQQPSQGYTYFCPRFESEQQENGQEGMVPDQIAGVSLEHTPNFTQLLMADVETNGTTTAMVRHPGNGPPQPGENAIVDDRWQLPVANVEIGATTMTAPWPNYGQLPPLPPLSQQYLSNELIQRGFGLRSEAEAYHENRSQLSRGEDTSRSPMSVSPGRCSNSNSSVEELQPRRKSAEERRQFIELYRERKKKRNYNHVKYPIRKSIADKRTRVHGQFAPGEDENPLKENSEFHNAMWSSAASTSRVHGEFTWIHSQGKNPLMENSEVLHKMRTFAECLQWGVDGRVTGITDYGKNLFAGSFGVQGTMENQNQPPDHSGDDENPDDGEEPQAED